METKTNYPNSEIAEKWERLSDTQKAKLLLGSMRFLDQEPFIQQFGSIEGPDPELAFPNATGQPTNINNEHGSK